MAAGAGVDLHRRSACGANALPVIGGGLIALQNEKRQLRFKIADGAFEQRGLARTRRAHEIERQDLAACEPGAVFCRQRVVLGEDAGLERDQRLAMTVLVVMVMVMVVIVAVVMRVAVARAVAVKMLMLVMVMIVIMGVIMIMGMLVAERVTVLMPMIVGMAVPRAISMHVPMAVMMVGVFVRLTADQAYRRLAAATAMATHQAASSSSMVLMLSSSPCRRSTRREPQGQAVYNVGMANSVPQAAQRALPSISRISSSTPSSTEPSAAIGKQKAMASVIHP